MEKNLPGFFLNRVLKDPMFSTPRCAGGCISASTFCLLLRQSVDVAKGGGACCRKSTGIARVSETCKWPGELPLSRFNCAGNGPQLRWFFQLPFGAAFTMLFALLFELLTALFLTYRKLATQAVYSYFRMIKFSFGRYLRWE